MNEAARQHAAEDRWAEVRSRLRAAGLRWTPQRGAVLDVLADVDGHVTGAELVERSRRIDPETTPSTVYRTLDVLEELGVVAHSHGREGRQEFHVNPVANHGHLVCSSCGRSWELGPDEVGPLVDRLHADRGFAVSVGHLSVEGRCATCGEGDRRAPDRHRVRSSADATRRPTDEGGAQVPQGSQAG